VEKPLKGAFHGTKSLRAMIFESQLHGHGARDHATEEKIRHEFRELYFPAESKWREKALADGRQAFEGILTTYNILQQKT